MDDKLKTFRNELKNEICKLIVNIFNEDEKIKEFNINNGNWNQETNEGTIETLKHILSTTFKIDNSHFFLKTKYKPLEVRECLLLNCAYNNIDNSLHFIIKTNKQIFYVPWKKISTNDMVKIYDKMRGRYEFVYKKSDR